MSCYINILIEYLMFDIVVQVGFACLESACVHRKNTVNMVFSNILCLCKYIIYFNH